ncbi:hypothetical protein ACQZ6S_21715 [Agrobacterium tumefaciens]
MQIEFKQAGLKAASNLELDERQTRRLIDVQLIDAGWEADSDGLTFQKGARPEEGRNLAIAEWPSEGGHHLWAPVLGIRSPTMPKRYPARLENQGIKGI